MRYIDFLCLTAALICNVTAEFICVSYTYEYQKKVVGLDTHCLCNQSVHKNVQSNGDGDSFDIFII